MEVPPGLTSKMKVYPNPLRCVLTEMDGNHSNTKDKEKSFLTHGFEGLSSV